MTRGIPDVALTAKSRSLVRTFLRSPIDGRSWRATGAVLLGFIIAVVAISLLSATFSAGGSLLLILIGIPILGLGMEICRVIAQVERWRMTMVDRRPLIPHAYREFDPHPHRPFGPWVRAWAEAEFIDPSRWRDVVYIVLNFPLSMMELALTVALWCAPIALLATPLVALGLSAAGTHFPVVETLTRPPAIVALVVLGLLAIPVAASAVRGMVLLHRAVVEGLLCVNPAEALRQDVERLRGSRSAAIELEATELRRIERDLHDGAQQRLVMLAIDLGIAAERIDTDPAAAKSLVADAREQAGRALAELRDLVRGISPSILLDRGLVAALGAVAGNCPITTTVDGRLAPGERLAPAVERAAYFVVAEALANVAKHSGASQCGVTVGRQGARLVVEIRDDGHGGATMGAGGGLAGLRDRVEALDGSFTLSSPPGGPTVLHAELPAGPFQE